MFPRSSKSCWTRAATAAALLVAVTTIPVSAFASGQLILPAWDETFHSSVQPKQRLASLRADTLGFAAPSADGTDVLEMIFIEDILSDGHATDMSARTGAAALNDDIVFNDLVSAEHDLGNAYVLTEVNAAGDLQIYVGVELLSTPQSAESTDSYVEIEFTQEFVQAVAVNAPLKGQRTAGDLMVRINMQAGEPTSAEFYEWSTALGYQAIESVRLPSGGEQGRSSAMPYLIRSGTPPRFDGLDSPEVWDLRGLPVVASEPDRFLEVGLNVAALLNANPDFSSILLRTPEDLAIDSFRHLGHWGAINSLGVSNDFGNRDLAVE